MKSAPNHFQFCPACGDPSIQTVDNVSVRCPACEFELFMSPSISAAALIEDAAGNLLVIKRKKDPRKGCFGMPGGFANPKETLEETLIREVKEEVNLDLKIREARKNDSLTKAQEKDLKTKSKSFPHKVNTEEWHQVYATVKGDKITCTIDGEIVGVFKSKGFAHETKRLLRLLVPQNAHVDDVKIWRKR